MYNVHVLIRFRITCWQCLKVWSHRNEVDSPLGSLNCPVHPPLLLKCLCGKRAYLSKKQKNQSRVLISRLAFCQQFWCHSNIDWKYQYDDRQEGKHHQLQLHCNMWITFVCVRTSTHVTTLDVSPLVSNSAIAQNRIAQKVCQWKSRHACWLITRWFKWRSQFNGHGLFCREGKKQFAGRRPSQQLHVVVLSAEDSGRSHHEEDDSFLKSNTNWNIWVQLLGLSHSSTSCVMLGYTACS